MSSGRKWNGGGDTTVGIHGIQMELLELGNEVWLEVEQEGVGV
jgi:hypothetical protein